MRRHITIAGAKVKCAPRADRGIARARHRCRSAESAAARGLPRSDDLTCNSRADRETARREAAGGSGTRRFAPRPDDGRIDRWGHLVERGCAPRPAAGGRRHARASGGRGRGRFSPASRSTGSRSSGTRPTSGAARASPRRSRRKAETFPDASQLPLDRADGPARRGLAARPRAARRGGAGGLRHVEPGGRPPLPRGGAGRERPTSSSARRASPRASPSPTSGTGRATTAWRRSPAPRSASIPRSPGRPTTVRRRRASTTSRRCSPTRSATRSASTIPGPRGALMAYSNQGALDALMPGDVAGAVLLYGPARRQSGRPAAGQAREIGPFSARAPAGAGCRGGAGAAVSRTAGRRNRRIAGRLPRDRALTALPTGFSFRSRPVYERDGFPSEAAHESDGREGAAGHGAPEGVERPALDGPDLLLQLRAPAGLPLPLRRVRDDRADRRRQAAAPRLLDRLARLGRRARVLLDQGRGRPADLAPPAPRRGRRDRHAPEAGRHARPRRADAGQAALPVLDRHRHRALRLDHPRPRDLREVRAGDPHPHLPRA